jgi:endogenous inhibitor of DNA gyrase (YacG/DUF329 family)
MVNPIDIRHPAPQRFSGGDQNSMVKPVDIRHAGTREKARENRRGTGNGPMRAESCAICGNPLDQPMGRGRPKVYCSLRCRSLARSVVSKAKRKADREATVREAMEALQRAMYGACPVCGTPLPTSKTRPFKFCSHRCREAGHRTRIAYARLEP